MKFLFTTGRYYLSVLLIGSAALVCAQNDSTNNKHSFALFPAFSYAPETSLQFGAVAIWVLKSSDESASPYQRQSSITPYFLYTFKNQILTSVNVDYYFPNGNNLSIAPRYFNFPDFYFGIGNDGDPDISESYTNVFFQIQGQYLKPINEKMFIGGAFDMHFTSIKGLIAGGLLETDVPVGLSGGTIIGLGPSFRYDTRDYTIYPTKGHFFAVRTLFNYLGSFSYAYYELDARKYVSLWNEQNILAFQIRTNIIHGSEVPFYKLPQLGGDDRLRGIANASLYRDRQLLYTQVEYRRPLFWRFGMVVFAGVGEVANNFGDFRLSEFKYVAGLGGRFAAIPKKKLNIRLDLGVARGGQTGIYVGLSEAF